MNLSINQPSSALSYIERQNKEREEKDEKLASGKRINSAADDPAGIQISSRLTAEINGYQQQSYNSQDQVNNNNVQEGGLSAIDESLQRANELSIQSGNPLSDASAIQDELDQLTEQINTIAGEVLGDPSFVSGLDASDPAATQAALEDAFASVNESATALGAQSNALNSQVATYETTRVNVSAARSRIEDTDYAATSSDKERNNVLLQAAIVNKKDEEARKGLLINHVV
ncbi:MAG: flagellin [Colwellia sp.]|nr:flagellin [Colwellia sp.]